MHQSKKVYDFNKLLDMTLKLRFDPAVAIIFHAKKAMKDNYFLITVLPRME